MKIKHLIISFFCAVCLAWMASPVLAQSGFSLNVNRTFGYSSGSQIRGTFNLAVIGQGSIQSVTYLLDGQAMKQVTSAPFTLSFNTTDYPSGFHDLSASVQTADGQTTVTPVQRFEFATPEQESASVKSVIIPIIGGVVLIVLLMVGGQFLFFRNRQKNNIPLGSPRNYGFMGGGVCPRCHRPFAFTLLAMNAGLGKFTRCEFCGKWSIVRRLSLADLRAAEAAEITEGQPDQPIPQKTEKEKLNDLIDDSRFTDHS